MKPVLYTFRRCPFAMRARMALQVAGIDCEQREVVLKNKPPQLLSASPKGTVPVLVLADGQVIDESLDIMFWALDQHDPKDWLNADSMASIKALIADNDGPFKGHLDRYKYPNRYEGVDGRQHRGWGLEFLKRLDTQLSGRAQLFGFQVSIADIAIFPFVRQFANADRDWFDTQDLAHLQPWLRDHIASKLFEAIMHKQTAWLFQEYPAY